MEILFQDNHILALNKPSGLLTQADSTQRASLEEEARRYLKEKTKKPRVFLHGAHRLDRVTSGVCLFAKTSKALRRLQAAFRKREVFKSYLAIVASRLPAKYGTIEIRQTKKAQRACLSQEGKLSILSYEQVASWHGLYLIKINLTTGRYHQIRLSLAQAGAAIVGDRKYGSCHPLPFDGILLHQRQLTFQHPTSQWPVNLIAALPENRYWSPLAQLARCESSF